MIERQFPLFRTLARTQIQYGLAAEIGDENSNIENAVKGAKLEIMRWVYKSVNVLAPGHIDLSTPFENNDTPGVKYGLATNGTAWVAKMERSDEQVHGRHWTTEINVTVSGNAIVYSTRVA